jgi:hypothetical protein
VDLLNGYEAGKVIHKCHFNPSLAFVSSLKSIWTVDEHECSDSPLMATSELILENITKEVKVSAVTTWNSH